MKAKLTIAIFMLMALIANGQNETYISPGQIGEIKVTPPEFAGTTITSTTQDLSLINRYLAENVVYPDNTASYGPEGTEVVQFTVTSKGNVTDFKVINSVSMDIDNEIIRVLKSTNGMWKPGYNDSQAVDMTKEVSMMFCNGSNQEVKPARELFTEYATVSFNKGSNALFEKQNVNKALKFFSDGIHYLPNDKSLLLMRGLCRYELGDKDGAKEDWNRMSNLGYTLDMSEYADRLQGMKGYEELMAVLNK